MGRRSNASKLEDNDTMHARECPSVGKDGSSQHVVKNKSSKQKMMKPKTIRRSQRIQNTSISARGKKQHVTEHIVVTEIEEQDDEPSSDKEEKDGEILPEPDHNDRTMEEQHGDGPSGHEEGKIPEPDQNELTMEEQDGEEPLDDEVEKLAELVQNKTAISEKVDYLIELVEGQEKTIEELKAKARDDRSSSQDAKYRSLYFKSQKKIEDLTKENCQMAMKLENALGKLEVYERGHHLLHAEVLDKVKDFIPASNPCPGDEPEEPRVANAKKKRKSGRTS